MERPIHAHVLQHVPYEGPGTMATWLAQRGIPLSCTRLYAGEPLPAPERVDWLIVMGGPMGVHDDAGHLWFAAEKSFIRQCLREGDAAVLGVCLGAQLIAHLLGARVYANPVKEIGWFPISRTDQGRTHPATAAWPDAPEVFHWHGDTFDLPRGASHLAASRNCRHQAFALGDRVIGLQFHLEVTPEAISGMIPANAHDLLGPSAAIQSANDMRDDAASRCAAVAPLISAVMEAQLAALRQSGSR